MTYDSLVSPARVRLAQASLEPLLEPDVQPDELLAFLIYFSAFGVRMSEPAEGWIRRAGRRCVSMGSAAVGQALMVHASPEAGHHLLLIDDVGRLVGRWNAEHPEAALQAAALLAAAPTEGARRYVELHESVIAGDSPFGQAAIEHEIEALSVRLGPRLIAQSRRLLGDAILPALSFLILRVEIDPGRTHLNEQVLRRLIEEDGARAETLAQTGVRALDAYASFLDDCRAAARTLVETAGQLAGDGRDEETASLLSTTSVASSSQ